MEVGDYISFGQYHIDLVLEGREGYVTEYVDFIRNIKNGKIENKFILSYVRIPTENTRGLFSLEGINWDKMHMDKDRIVPYTPKSLFKDEDLFVI